MQEGDPGQFVFEERAGESVPSVLYDEHVKLTSKSHITAFAGYLMPLWYSSIVGTQSTDGPEKPHPNRREPKSLSTPKDNGSTNPANESMILSSAHQSSYWADHGTCPIPAEPTTHHRGTHDIERRCMSKPSTTKRIKKHLIGRIQQAHGEGKRRDGCGRIVVNE